MNEDVQDRVVEGGVGCVTVRLPAAICQVELDRAADRIAGIKSDDGVGEIWSGGAIPRAKLDDLNIIAGDGMEPSAEVAGKPARLQFQFARGALWREQRALVETRGIAQLGITVSKQHGGRKRLSESSLPFGDKKMQDGTGAVSPRSGALQTAETNDGGLETAAPCSNVRDWLRRQCLNCPR